MSEPSEWLIYRGAGEPHEGIEQLPPPPPWRDFSGAAPRTPTMRTMTAVRSPTARPPDASVVTGTSPNSTGLAPKSSK